MREGTLVHAAPGVHLVHGSNTNWVILSEGDAVTLIDCGYPGDRQQVLDSLAAAGHSPEALTAILLTHAHNDHLGSAEYLSRTFDAPVYAHEAEVPHARREFLHQVSLGRVLRNSWRPGVLPWAVHALRSGGTTDARVERPQPFPTEGALDLPGRPVPVHTPDTPPTTAPTISPARASSSPVTAWSPATRSRARAGRSSCPPCSTGTATAPAAPWTCSRSCRATRCCPGTARCTAVRWARPPGRHATVRLRRGRGLERCGSGRKRPAWS